MDLIRKIIILSLIAFSVEGYTSVEKAEYYYRKSSSISSYPDVAKELIDVGLYYSAIPFVKEYLIRSNVRRNQKVDIIIDELITQVGVKQFEVLPENVLRKSSAPTIRYILAKKVFREKRYKEALSIISHSSLDDHALTPFANMLRGSIYTIIGKYNTALPYYRECISSTNQGLRKAKTETAKRQLKINNDLCVLGISRSQFAAGDFESANLSYLDLPKESPVWPEILFEEAWNSFYLRDYNRTLGKLVTYNAPIFNYMFNPEIETLKALTYMELCLWNDSKKVVDDFYREYGKISKALGRILTQNKKNYKYYYLLAKNNKGRILSTKDDVLRLVKSVTRDPIYQELNASFSEGAKELKLLKKVRSKSFRSILLQGLRQALVLQRNLLGAYVRKGLDNYKNNIDKTFEGMSFIRLEVLSRRKESLYSPVDSNSRNRGDIKYLKRNDKQYFWTFNGEFWADELGDYVFALKSECK
jgi:hypothetical protein